MATINFYFLQFVIESVLFLGENPVEYVVEVVAQDSAVIVRDDVVSVKISLTSPLLREASQEGKNDAANINGGTGDVALLPREPCLRV